MTAPPATLAPVDELSLLLRPAAGGVYVVSTGRAEQLAMQRRLYGVASEDDVRKAFRAALGRIAEAKVVVLGVPSDVGAGFVRGANLAPQAIRAKLLEDDPGWADRAARDGIVDIGDVFVVPQLLHDEMLSDAQIAATRRAIYADVDPTIVSRLPVSPLSIAERVLELVFSINPRVSPFVLGGDHSTAWPVVSALGRARTARGAPPWAIVQSDAHTDLLEERLGVKYCFATWSFHANELLGRGGKLVQVGTRASRRDRAYWEGTLDVRQRWAAECKARPAAAIDEIVAHLRALDVRAVYFSNDIDGTDERFADATGTPEPEGLEPGFVVELIRRLGRDIGLCGGDVMEVAPLIARTPDGAARTLSLAVRYMRETIGAILARPAG